MVLLDEARVRELRLRVLVQRLHVRVRRRRVEVEEALLHVLTVIAFRAGEAEQPLLQDRIAPVPQREGEADAALAIGDAEQPVFAPAIGAEALPVALAAFILRETPQLGISRRARLGAWPARHLGDGLPGRNAQGIV